MLQRTGRDAPPYTIARLFESGLLSLEDEAALNEIRTIQNGFERWLSPGRGWMSSGDGNSVPIVPRALGQPHMWRRYARWQQRWSLRVQPASPSKPWGMTAAGLVVALATTPLTFEQAAALLGWRVNSVLTLFVKAVRDYPKGAILVAQAPEPMEHVPDAPNLAQDGEEKVLG